MSEIGTLIVSGDWPAVWDGACLGVRHGTKRFKLRTDGIERKGVLYKTLDYMALVEQLGVINPKIVVTYKEI